METVYPFPGHACGVPKPGSAPNLKYFTHIVQRYAKIRFAKKKRKYKVCTTILPKEGIVQRYAKIRFANKIRK